MAQLAQEPVEDRLSTPHELGEVIGVLIVEDQLSMSALASLESEANSIERNELELWEEADRDRLREAAQIERLTSVILGRSRNLN
jgi:hypothetical protein